MESIGRRLQRIEFEGRIFFSFGIVALVCLVSFLGFGVLRNNYTLLGEPFGASPETSMRVGFAVTALLLAVASVLRMWAGSILSSRRMMAFQVQADALVTAGPYRLVRNPIYLADFIAYVGFALVLAPIGFALVALMLLHYVRLVRYEERCLERTHGAAFGAFGKSIPRFFPNGRSLRRLPQALREFEINFDGFRNNALYVLFIPGFLVSIRFLSPYPGIAIGLVAVLDWAVVHTVKGLPRTRQRSAPDFQDRCRDAARRTKVAGDVLYGQCWEDPELDRTAFRTGPDDVVFTIASGGCDALAFLIDRPAKVVALDINRFQIFLLQLKMAGFQALSHPELLEFLGVTPSTRRLALYARVRNHLGGDARAYWDGQPEKLDAGVIHCGRFEAYLGLVRRWFRRLLNGRALAERLFAAGDSTARAGLYHRKWDTWRWRALTGLLLSRTVMSRLFDPAFFAQLSDSFAFGEHFRGRVRQAVVDRPVADNWFLAYILTGNYRLPDALPTYLRAEHHAAIREGINRIELVTGSCEAYFPTLPAGAISRFNFTNIFEWMTPETTERLLRESVRVARDGAVLTYRNLLVPRSRPESLAQWIAPDPELSARLHEQDRSFIYRAYVVERVRKP